MRKAQKESIIFYFVARGDGENYSICKVGTYDTINKMIVELKMWDELEKALISKLKTKIIYTQLYGSELGIITFEGEVELVVEFSSKNTFLSGDVNIQTTISGFYKDFKYSPTEYVISTKVKDWDPCQTQSCNIWVYTIGLEEEELGYIHDEYLTFSEVLI